ncbi:MAG: hypothetical protein V9E88_17415 [Ferruginibacter sp.]
MVAGNNGNTVMTEVNTGNLMHLMAIPMDRDMQTVKYDPPPFKPYIVFEKRFTVLSSRRK